MELLEDPGVRGVGAVVALDVGRLAQQRGPLLAQRRRRRLRALLAARALFPPRALLATRAPFPTRALGQQRPVIVICAWSAERVGRRARGPERGADSPRSGADPRARRQPGQPAEQLQGPAACVFVLVAHPAPKIARCTSPPAKPSTAPW